jgi:hypothetical protein
MWCEMQSLEYPEEDRHAMATLSVPYAGVAQTPERVSCKDEDAGSIPVTSSTLPFVPGRCIR